MEVRSELHTLKNPSNTGEPHYLDTTVVNTEILAPAGNQVPVVQHVARDFADWTVSIYIKMELSFVLDE
jgi:hypothetical protein